LSLHQFRNSLIKLVLHHPIILLLINLTTTTATPLHRVFNSEPILKRRINCRRSHSSSGLITQSISPSTDVSSVSSGERGIALVGLSTETMEWEAHTFSDTSTPGLHRQLGQGLVLCR
jgi:hypothetical protein